jgi:hypothetical protein
MIKHGLYIKFSDKESQKSSRIDGASLPAFCAAVIIEVFMAPMEEPAKTSNSMPFL